MAWDKVYDKVTERFKKEAEFIVMDAGYKTAWIVKKVLEDGRIPILPYTRRNNKKDVFKPWEYEYDAGNDSYICPEGNTLRHTTTDREGKRTYRSRPGIYRNCPCREACVR